MLVLDASALCTAMTWSPVSLGSILEYLENAEHEERFYELLQEICPQKLKEIWNAERGPGETQTEARIRAFHKFVSQHFEVYDELESYQSILYTIPYTPHGIHWDEFHELPTDPSQLMLRALCGNVYYMDDGIRASLFEEVEPIVGKENLAALGVGYTTEQLVGRLHDTDFAGLARYAEYLDAGTGNLFLDTNYETDYEVPFTRDTFERLTDDYEDLGLFYDEVGLVEAWLLQDPPRNFGRIVAYMNDPHPNKRRLPSLQALQARRKENATLRPDPTTGITSELLGGGIYAQVHRNCDGMRYAH